MPSRRRIEHYPSSISLRDLRNNRKRAAPAGVGKEMYRSEAVDPPCGTVTTNQIVKQVVPIRMVTAARSYRRFIVSTRPMKRLDPAIAAIAPSTGSPMSKLAKAKRE